MNAGRLSGESDVRPKDADIFIGKPAEKGHPPALSADRPFGWP